MKKYRGNLSWRALYFFIAGEYIYEISQTLGEVMYQLNQVVGRADAAFLYEQYAPAIFAYLLRQVGSREEAEDILLEVFLALLEKMPKLDQDEQRMRAWLWTVARNKAADYHRRFGRHPNIPLIDIAEMIYESEELAPEQVVLRHEEYEKLRKTMKGLSEVQQEVVQLRFGHGLSCAEIAQVVDKTETAVRMVLYRALKWLRASYRKQ